MKRLAVLLVSTTAVLAALGSYAFAGGGKSNVKAEDMIGYLEAPSVSTVARGAFDARINDGSDTITWKLSYRQLEGAVQQAHIHFGQRSVNGGITVFLCTNLGNGPPGTQPCPPAPAQIGGTITRPDVSFPVPATAAARAQGIDTGEFEELVAAIRAGVTYANVHSTKWPGGEVRGQINDGNNNGDDDDD